MDVRKIHAEQADFWDKRAKPWDSSSASVSYLTLFYEKYRNKLKPPYIDIGCGAGKFLRRLAEDGIADMYGMDISPELVRITRDKLREFLGEETEKRIQVMDMLDLSKKYPAEFFNTIIFSGVLQQTLYSAARPTMEEIAAISASGAIMYFSTRSALLLPEDRTLVENERGTFRLSDGLVKCYFTESDIHDLTKGLFEIVELDEKDQTEKISGAKIKNWEGVLKKLST